ncbi:MAG: type II secretion system protein [Candidatus Paceibacterota bacterium]|jgi:prepilin-type N-terminal cleavage/methylation domain-containing protein
MKKTIIRKKGFGLIEVLVGIAISSTLCFIFLDSMWQAGRINRASKAEWQSSMYLRELAEIARDLENSDWNELSLSCTETLPCHPVPVVSGSAFVWTLASGEEILDEKFTRSLVVEEVCRSSVSFPNTIVPCPGTIDPDTKRATAKIRWESLEVAREETITLYSYKLQ